MGATLQTTITASDLAVEIALAIAELVVGFYLLRKVNHDDIRDRWADIWGETN